MALPVDGPVTVNQQIGSRAWTAMPPWQGLAMPVQDLAAHPGARKEKTPRRVAAARLIAFGGALVLGGLGTYEMIQAVSSGGVTAIESVMTALFAVTFAWIALAAAIALAGLVLPPAEPAGLASRPAKLTTRTALVMPIFHEDPVRTSAALQAMAEALHACGEGGSFEIVILSDSRDSDAWVRETAAADRLHTALTAVMPVWYRRRWDNSGRKAGNLEEFITNWGGRYDHLVVLDADSIMAGETLVRLAAAMEADPRLGILQSMPVSAGGSSLFARLQQFASRVHGPIIARGLAAWQGSDGNYWGHNAIIRTRAFAEACGLPALPGREPLGGSILSHDFVEAALIRRAGWRVQIAPSLETSWEESPPSLIDSTDRDRRWVQGNLQHGKVIGARGLAWPSRVHLAIGMMSYLASPLWLALLLSGFVLALQAHLIRPDYFAEGVQLFPSWPHFDSERMVRLFIITTAVLLMPKTLGLGRALVIPAVRRGCGGSARLLASFVLELAASAIVAPIILVVHSRHIYEVLVGRDAGWASQARHGVETSWSRCWRRYRWHTALGAVAAGCAWYLSPAILAWLSPTLIGLLLAVPLAKASGSTRMGGWLRRAGLLVIPEESRPNQLFNARASLAERFTFAADLTFSDMVTDQKLRAAHFRLATRPPRRRGAPDAHLLTAEVKIRDAASFDEALAWLTREERLWVAADCHLAERMAMLPRHGQENLPAADSATRFQESRASDLKAIGVAAE